jgi:hypothetical protein
MNTVMAARKRCDGLMMEIWKTARQSVLEGDETYSMQRRRTKANSVHHLNAAQFKRIC